MLSSSSSSALKTKISTFLKRLWDKEIKYFVLRGSLLPESEEVIEAEPPITNKVLLSGSFNPLHDGHIDLLAACVAHLKDSRDGGFFTLPVVNCDKGAIELDVALARVMQFAQKHLDVILYSEPIFSKKSSFFPNCSFAMGYDTLVRVYALHYYENSETKMIEALDQIYKNKCDFIVSGRMNPETQEFEQFGASTVEQIPILKEEKYASMIRVLPEFRNDLSSTELRAQNITVQEQ